MSKRNAIYRKLLRGPMSVTELASKIQQSHMNKRSSPIASEKAIRIANNILRTGK